MSEYWFQFARTGTPASSGSPEWHPHTVFPRLPNFPNLPIVVNKDWTLLLGKESSPERNETIEMKENFMRPRLEFLVGVLGLINEKGD